MKDIDVLCRNAVDVIEKSDLKARLDEGKPLRIKAGFDPSAPDIHLGHTVLLRKLREFQDLGHKVILIIGDATARIGDPTGQSKTRPILTADEVSANAKTYKQQAFKILDKAPKKIEVVHNSKWLDKPEMFKTLIGLCGLVTVDQLLVRDDFDKRRAAHKPIYLQELLYPMMQGYDSVAVKADVELGGTDQLFNLLMGRQIQSLYKMQPQVVMTMPLLVGLDGVQKMSKSLGNHIGVTDPAKDVFGKTMSIPDALMESWYDLLTQKSGREVSARVAGGLLHPRDAKLELGKELVARLYDKKTAEREAAEFDRVFSRREEPADPKVHALPAFDIDSASLLKQVKAVGSTSQAYRLIRQGAVTLDGQRLTDPKARPPLKDGSLLKVGKKLYFKIILKRCIS